MRKIWLLFVLFPVLSWGLTAREIIQKVDDNQVFSTQRFQATMTIRRGTKSLVKIFRGIGQTEGKKSFMEFTNPEDLGVKYLKIGNEMWIYFPDADDTLKLSGHMLRQGMMGSDLSYEDMLENDSLDSLYHTSLGASTNVRGVSCYQVVLEAKKEEATYARQVLFVDQEKYVIILANMYARGGRLIKVMWQDQFRQVSGVWVPTLVGIQDKRRKDSETVIRFEQFQVNIPVPAATFSKQNLMR